MNHISPHQHIKGSFIYEIVEENGLRVVERGEEKSNLILNQAFNFLAQRSYVENIVYCAIGVGTTPPLLTDTGLASESFRTNTLDTAIASPTTNSYAIKPDGSSTYTITRVFKFSSLDNYTDYGELGWSYSPIAGNNLFSKTIFPSPIRTPRGTYLRVTYTLTIGFAAPTSVFSNWGAGGFIYPPSFNGVSPSTHAWGSIAGFNYVGLRTITANGTVGFYDNALDVNEPCSSGVSIFMSQNGNVFETGGYGTSGTYNKTAASYSIGVSYSGGHIGNGVYVRSASFGRSLTGFVGSLGMGPTGANTLVYPGWTFNVLTGVPASYGLSNYPIAWDGTSVSGQWFAKTSRDQLEAMFTMQLTAN